MQRQQSRDEKTVAIASGLGLFCLVLAIGGLALWGVDSLLGLRESTMGPLLHALTVSASVVLVIYLARAGKR